MAIVTKSIGTNSRDYSTITLWEADLDEVAIYSSGDDAVGECYNDSAFDESVTINGGATVGLATVKLTAAGNEEHDGTAGTGVEISGTVVLGTSLDYTVELLEVKNQSEYVVDLSYQQDNIAKRLLVHGTGGFFGGVNGIRSAHGGTIMNSIVYNIESTRDFSAVAGISITSNTTLSHPAKCLNCTVFNASNSADGIISSANGIITGVIGEDSGMTLKNVVVMDTSGKTFNDFSVTPGSTRNHNLSSDATASGTGSLINKTSANQFVSTVTDSEDLHLKSGADAIDAGIDLGTTPTDVNLDIDGEDRTGEVWDIGADQVEIALAMETIDGSGLVYNNDDDGVSLEAFNSVLSNRYSNPRYYKGSST